MQIEDAFTEAGKLFEIVELHAKDDGSGYSTYLCNWASPPTPEDIRVIHRGVLNMDAKPFDPAHEMTPIDHLVPLCYYRMVVLVDEQHRSDNAAVAYRGVWLLRGDPSFFMSRTNQYVGCPACLEYID